MFGCKEKFTVYTDNNPLTYILSTAKLNATGHRWLASLSVYNFEIKYSPGCCNTNADILSRLPQESDESEEHNVIDHDTFINTGTAHSQVSLIETMCMSAQVPDFDEVEEEPLFKIRDLRSEQHGDPSIGPVIKAVSQGRFLKLNQYVPGTAINLLVREFNNVKIRRGLLYRDTVHGEQQKLQAVLPTLYKDMVR